MSSGGKFGGCEMFEICVVSDDVDWRSWTFKVVFPCFEGFEDCKWLLVMYIIVVLWGIEGLGVKRDWVDLRVIRGDDLQNGGEGVSISL